MAYLDIGKISLEEAVERAEKRLGYKVSYQALVSIATYAMKAYLLNGGHVTRKEK